MPPLRGPRACWWWLPENFSAASARPSASERLSGCSGWAGLSGQGWSVLKAGKLSPEGSLGLWEAIGESEQCGVRFACAAEECLLGSAVSEAHPWAAAVWVVLLDDPLDGGVAFDD